jgi:hypothetical protein
MPARRASSACDRPTARRLLLILSPIGARIYPSACNDIDKRAGVQGK